MRMTKWLGAGLVSLALIAPSVAQGKSITVSWTQEPDNMNPMYTVMSFAGYTYQLIYSAAWNFDAEGLPFPVLLDEMPSVENGGINAEGTVFTLKVRQGLTWSDGDPLDSADFKFTYDMIMSESNTPLSRGWAESAVSVEAPDPQTVVVTFEKPFAPWLGMFNYVLPEHIFGPIFEAEGSLDAAQPNLNPVVSSGPYVLAEWDRGNFMRLTANSAYALGQPKIDTVVVTFVPDDQTYLQNAVTSQSDIITFIPFSDVPIVEEAGMQVQIVPSGYNEAWYLNVGPNAHPAMQDVRVRRAIALGFDRFSFTEDVLLGKTYPPASFWENTPYANPELEAYPYDPIQAAALLDEAGWVDNDGDGIRDKDGQKLTLRFITNQRAIRKDVQALAQQQLGEIGIEVVLQNFDSNVFFNGFTDGGPQATGQYEIAELSGTVASFPDPDTRRFLCDEIPTPEKPTGSNWTGYCNPEVDALFKAQITETDTAERIALFHQIDALMHEDVIWIGVWHDADVWVFNPRIQNVQFNGVVPFYNIHEWDISS
ncbi:MAG: peptide ABC transporter substrate-binding protein [Anaerolineae bacterium]|nr:peptide ABC transporter substrate-binding protein [Anaerolineae bacterium]MDW8171578.1 peptide ABC transporter substrate-binding protein [Anaerolineae bacterium]